MENTPNETVVEIGSGFAPEACGPLVDENTQVMAPTAQPGNTWAEALRLTAPQPGFEVQ